MTPYKSTTPKRDLIFYRFFSGTCLFCEVLASIVILCYVLSAALERPDFNYSKATFWVVISAVLHNFIRSHRKSVDEKIADLYEQINVFANWPLFINGSKDFNAHQ